MGDPMRYRILLVLALGAALALVSVATGATKKTHALNETARMAVISPEGASPVKWAGEATGKPGGRSAILLTSTAANGKATGKGTQYTKRGAIFATTANTIEPQADGSTRFPGTFKITGGTGKYRGATGSGTFDGVVPANSSVLEVTLKGKIRY
jgi:hypothetical protein